MKRMDDTITISGYIRKNKPSTRKFCRVTAKQAETVFKSGKPVYVTGFNVTTGKPLKIRGTVWKTGVQQARDFSGHAKLFYYIPV